jgi:hypothetical protein
VVSTTLATGSILAASTFANSSTENQWALQYLRANQIWSITRGFGSDIAVIDTGVQPNSDLSSNLLLGADFSDTTGKTTGNGQVDEDSYGHGTGEATLIGGSGVSTLGLAPDSTILPVRASDGTSAPFALGTAPAIEYAIAHHVKVINIALTFDRDDAEIRSAVQDALNHNVVVVAAVGSDGSSQQYYPAAWPGVVGVGAIDSSGAVWSQSDTGADVALVAPGVHILRDDNQGRVGYSDGTSEATAYVSAGAALVRSAHPGWSAAEVVRALEVTADKPAAMRGAARDDRYGAGVLDVLAAVRLGVPPAAVGSGGSVVQEGGGGWGWWIGGGSAVAVGVVIVFVAWWRRLWRG